VAIVPAALWHSKPLFAPKTLHFLVIDCPAFCTGVVIPGPEMAQPGPQRRIRTVGEAVTGNMFPFAISVSATFSNSASAKNRLSVAFSRSRAFEPLDPSPRPGLVYAAAETAIERPGPPSVAVAGRTEALPQVEGLSNSG
jgi:hypothetical protein